MNRETLTELLTKMPPIPGLREQVETAVGGDTALDDVEGAHVVIGYETAAVYLVTRTVFAMFEASIDGRSYALTCPIGRIRRVGRFEDANYTRLVIELDADRTTTRSTMRDDGTAEGEILPAGYELLETDSDGRSRLNAFHQDIARALRG